MGRTKRQRLRKKNYTRIEKLSTNFTIIEISQWMKSNYWKNETKLSFGIFPETGRGLFSSQTFQENSILIQLPFQIMITFITVEKSDIIKQISAVYTEKLSIRDLIALYLVFEYHLGRDSFWYTYIKSLPQGRAVIPWLCTEEELNYMDDDMVRVINDEKGSYEDSWARVQFLLESHVTCSHCKTRVSLILTRGRYLWAYNIINTRAVYINPNIIREMSNGTLDHYILDEPNMALCPFLDMFNHSCNVQTLAELVRSEGKWSYRLITKNKYKPYEQIFISYGDHNNKILLSQYGFVVPLNINDIVKFTLDEILNVSNMKADSRQYKFLNEHRLKSNIHVGYSGCSFSLKATLYVLINNKQEKDWSAHVYSSKFTAEQLSVMHNFVKQLLERKLKCVEIILEKIKNRRSPITHNLNLYVTYLNHRTTFMKYILSNIMPRYIM